VAFATQEGEGVGGDQFLCGGELLAQTQSLGEGVAGWKVGEEDEAVEVVEGHLSLLVGEAEEGVGED
jgi:hypothetical protein